MATCADYIKYQPSADLKTFQLQFSKLSDEMARKLIKGFARGSIWASDVTTPDCKDDSALFKLYEFESNGIVSSKIEHKNESRYERQFYLTELGKKLLPQ